MLLVEREGGQSPVAGSAPEPPVGGVEGGQPLSTGVARRGYSGLGGIGALETGEQFRKLNVIS